MEEEDDDDNEELDDEEDELDEDDEEVCESCELDLIRFVTCCCLSARSLVFVWRFWLEVGMLAGVAVDSVIIEDGFSLEWFFLFRGLCFLFRFFLALSNAPVGCAPAATA